MNFKSAIEDALTGKFGASVVEVAPRHADGAVVLARGSDIKPEAITWLWRFWLALGKLLILAGAPGAGKTTIALAFAATLTGRGCWPDGSHCDGGNVLIWSGEDDPADTLVPRLMAMGADLTRVYFVTGARIGQEVLPFDPARDLLTLTEQAQRIGNIRLLVVDPVVSAIAGDSHKNAEVRRGLQPLVDLASSLGAAVIGITHLSKGTVGRDPTERVTGSIAFSAVARIVLLAAKIKGENGKDRRVLVRAKANIAPDSGGYEYYIEQTDALPGIPTSIVTWGDAIEGTARELLAEAEAEPDEVVPATTDAADALARILGRHVMPRSTVTEQMRAEGFTQKQVRSARERLRVIVKRSGFGEAMTSYWSLPPGADVPDDHHSCPDVPTNSEGANGHEWQNAGTTDGNDTHIQESK